MTAESRPSVARQGIEVKSTADRIIGSEETARYILGLRARQLVFEAALNGHNRDDSDPYAKAKYFYLQYAPLFSALPKSRHQTSPEGEALRILRLDIQAADRFARSGILRELKDLEAEEIENLEAGIEIPFINPRIAELLSRTKIGKF